MNAAHTGRWVSEAIIMKKIIAAALVAALATTLGSIAASAETRIGATVTLRTDVEAAFACYDQKAISDAYEIGRKSWLATRKEQLTPGKWAEDLIKEPGRVVRGTPEAQKYLEIGCFPIVSADGPFEIMAYNGTDNCKIRSSTIKPPAWVRCFFLWERP
jgi:hypothetical protein